MNLTVKPSKLMVCKFCERPLNKEYEDIGICAHCLDVENDALDYVDELDNESYPSHPGMWDLKMEDDY